MASSKQQTLLLQNAREIQKQTEELVKYLEQKGVDELNFDANSPLPPADDEYDALRYKVVQSAEDLIKLAKGPLQWVRTFICSQHDLGAWQIALRFNLFTSVPLDAPISVSEVAATVKVDKDRIGHVLKHLASQRCFHEVEEDVFAHTAMSAFIAKSSDIRATLAFQADEMFEAASLMAAAIEKAPESLDVAQSAFQLRFGMTPYEWYAANPERGSRFAAAMAGYGQMNRDTTTLRDSYPWADLGDATVVDVGGGSGHVSLYLAQQFPRLQFIVQDYNTVMLEQGPKRPDFESVKTRMSFMKYDFYEPQPIHNANLFFMRQIIHNYSDDKSVRILKSFVPALEKCAAGTPLLINDMILPAPNSKLKAEEHHLRQIDMAMLGGYSAKQRSLKEWAKLLETADARLKIVKVHGEGILGLMEVQLVR
ncbi:unnamed protein product [Periconia digitata]|uniref:O-methyltransferase C-terminal domain-containing protein n=1 Tax=Periconia digitata TaxID=1303443 RepID=A0A9W4XQ87_9PLEO|nr:unnamed protein product [Periconia digitata]